MQKLDLSNNNKIIDEWIIWMTNILCKYTKKKFITNEGI